jgi:PKD repeat protein
MTRILSSRRFGLFLVLLGLSGLCLDDSRAQSGAASLKTQKLRVSEPRVAEELISGGAELIADYGSFQVLRVDKAQAAVAQAKPEVESITRHNIIELNTGPLDTTTPAVQALRVPAALTSGKRLHLIQFAGPLKPEWRDALEKTGVEIVTYIPNNTYLIYGDGGALGQMQSWAAGAAFVQWEGKYLDDYKVHPQARSTGRNPQKLETDLFAIQLLADGQANAATLKVINGLKLAPIQRQSRVLNYLNVLVRLPASALATLAAEPEVISIQPYIVPQKRDERQDQIVAGQLNGTVPSGPGYLAWLSSKGFSQAQFTASGFAVDVSDSGIDNGTTAPGHFGLYVGGDSSQASRVLYNRLVGSPNAGSTLQGCDGHGTLNTHIIAGYNDQPLGFPHTDSAGFRYGLGICPFVNVGSSVIFDSDTFTFPNYASLQSQAYHDGARVSNNSWGANTAGGYNSDAQQYDALVRDAQPAGATFSTPGNQEMVIVFAAGNAGSGAQTVGAPGTAKNVFTVGASENVRSLSTAEGGVDAAGDDGCSLPDTGADSANDIASFSSRGPCSDGRKKPDIVAPGTHISGGVAQDSPPPSPASTGSAIACFKATGVCGLPGGGSTGSADNFFPLNQQFYTTSSGTSHSTPALVGCCALLRQFFINQSLNPPSPAMTKAYLMNSTRYLDGSGANDSLWSSNQGMGEVDLDTAFDGTARALRDEVPADKLTGTGQTRTFTGNVADGSKPFRVTLAWSDAPGNTTGNAYNNDLDLTVTVGGNTYKGNVFSGQFSTTGGSADSQNNVESVFLPAGTTGSFTVTVTAANINSDGVPNEAPSLDQDFALVIYNATQQPAPIVVPRAATLVAESCIPTNGAPDPGEMVTFNFNLQNVGTANTLNLVGTLLASNGVTAPSGPQTYGALTFGGPAVSQPFTFTANGSCGGTIIPMLQLQDGTNNLGVISFSLSLGVPSVFFAENFDSVSAPALPANWATSATGSESAWVTTSGSADSAPNSAFSPDPPAAGVNELDSPALVVPAAQAQLSFRHSYDFEGPSSGNVGYDGGVLEIQINNGSFTDILAAGGSFVSGGYNRTLSTSFGNALGGRQAWSGNSGGFITTIVNVPAAAAGQSVRLRWRASSDSSVSAGGWYVDTVTTIAAICCSQTAPPSAAFTGAPVSGSAPLSVTFTDSSTGAITNHFWDFGDGVTTNTTATTVFHIYQNVGTNTVILAVSGPTGTNSLLRPAYIVATNATALLVSNSLTLVSEFCTNGAVDPGETVTMNFGLKNIGSRPTTNLVATLLTSGGIVAPSSAQVYGALNVSTIVSLPFSFTAMGTCGAIDTAVLQLQDGSVNLGTISYSFTLGVSAPLVQNFDGVTAPALPSDWMTAATGAQSSWTTSTNASDTALNAAFSPDPAAAGINELDSPAFTLPASAQLTFRHNYNLEVSTSLGIGYDGAVLEMKIGNGAFADIVAAGGNFVSGGYTHTISSAYGNPLAGRQAWSGNSGGFVTTVVNLPTNAVGQPVQLRWRCGSDQTVSFPGWYVDSISIGGFSCCSSPPIITSQPQKTAVVAGNTATFTVSANGTAPLVYQWQFRGTNIAGAMDTKYSRANAQFADAGNYDVIIANNLGSVTSALVPLVLISQPPQLLAPGWLSNGAFSFTLKADTGFNYLVEATTNLSTWSPVATVSNATGQVLFTETNISAYPFRAYRARLIP